MCPEGHTSDNRVMTYDTILKLWSILNWPTSREISLVVSASEAAKWGLAPERLRRRASIDMDLTINPRRKVVRGRDARAADMEWTPEFEEWLAAFLRQEAIEAQVYAIRQRQDETLVARATELIDQQLSA